MDSSRAIHSRIKEIFDDRVMKRDALIRSRRAEISSKTPEYDACQNEIAHLSVKRVKASISKNQAEEEKIAASIEELMKKRDVILQNLGYPVNYLEPDYVCPLCHDTGSVDVDGERKRCVCYKRLLIDLTYQQNGILNHGERFDTISYTCQVGDDAVNFNNVVKKVKNFANNFGKRYQNMVLFGDPGLGKTMLCNCLINEINEKTNFQYTCIYQSAPQMFQKIMSEKYNRGAEEYDLILDCDLLVIDDLGTEIVSQAVVSELYQLLNSRINMNKPFVISTNLLPDDLEKTYGARITSRIYANKDVTVLCYLTGNDVRKMKIGARYAV